MNYSKKKQSAKEVRTAFYQLIRQAAAEVQDAQNQLHAAHNALVQANARLADAMELDIQPDGRHDWHGEMLAIRSYQYQTDTGLKSLLPLFAKLPDSIMTSALLELHAATTNHVMNGSCVEQIQTPCMGMAVLRAHERAQKLNKQVTDRALQAG